MSLPGNIRDREYSVFTLCNDKPAKNVCIANGENEAVPVFEVGQPGTSLLEYSEANSLAGLSSADVLTYTVPVGKELGAFEFFFSGENKAVFRVILDGSPIAKSRTWFTRFDGRIAFKQLKVLAGSTIRLEVFNSTNSIADFNATLEGVLYES